MHTDRHYLDEWNEYSPVGSLNKDECDLTRMMLLLRTTEEINACQLYHFVYVQRCHGCREGGVVM